MKALMLIVFILAGASANAARYSTNFYCELASGWDSLQSFNMTNDGGARVTINGVRMRDSYPKSPYGIWVSPAYPGYHFQPRPSTPGPSIDVYKTIDGARLIYHCARLN